MSPAVAGEHRDTEPSADGLAAMASALGSEGEIARVERLHGGIATSVHLVELTTTTGIRRVVLKRFAPGSPVPEHEWNALQLAATSSVPSPSPLLLDAGAWFDGPSIVTDHLPGRPELTPRDPAAWTAALAAALASIHGTPIHDLPSWLRRPAIWDRWEVRGLPPGPRLAAISSAVGALRARAWPSAFCHGDFHPGNVLFDGDALVGVVDWTSARVAPVLSDLGRARAALAIWPGGDAPDLLAEAYAATTGSPLDGLAFWDTLSGAITLEHSPRLPLLYAAFGVALTSEEVAARAGTFVDRALRRLG